MWFGGLFRALNIPAGDSAQFQPGQVVRAGAIYYDSTGVDSGLYVWSGLAWQKQNANNYTASQGITLSGNDFQLGGLMTDIKSLTWNGGNSEMTFGQIYGTQKYGRGNLNVVNIDTMPNPDTSRFWGLNSHTIFRSPSYTASIYRLGTNLQVTYENADSVNLRSFGGDFGSAVRSNFHFKRLPGYTGRSVYEIGNKTLSDIIPIHIANLDWGDESSTAGTNYKYVRGYMGGFSAYLVTRANDTLTNWVGFNSHGFGDGYVNWAADYVGGFLGNASTTNVGKHWYLYNRGQYSPSWMASALYIGDSTLTPSALLNVSSTTQGVVWSRMTTAQKNAIASPVTGLIVYDTDLSNYYFYNGSAWTVMGGSSITNFNDIGDATAAGLVTVGNNSQQWDFTGLTGSGLLIQSNTTAATSFLHKLFRVITTGANATSSVRSFASEISNSHSGTNSTNVGLIASAINGTNNYAIVVGAGNGQIGFGTDTPDPSALLDVSSTTQGALLPRMTTAQQDAITSPANGLLIYNTDSSLFRFYDGAWNSIAAGSSGSGGGNVTKVGTPSNHQWGVWTGDGTLEGVSVTASRAVVTDADGEPVAATTTATEIGYVNGVTSAIQTQIDGKIGGSLTSTRIPFASAATTLTDAAELIWDNTGKELRVGGGSDVGAFPLQVYKASNPVFSLHNGTQFSNLLTGSSLSIFQFPVANKFGIQAATSITDNGGSGVYPLIAFGSGSSHSVMIGGVAFSATPSAKLDVLGTTEQLRLRYDASNYLSVTVASNGSTTFNATGTSPTITISDPAIFSSTARLASYTVATLPAGVQGDVAYVTDASGPTYLATVVGGGAVVTPVFYNGTNWVCH